MPLPLSRTAARWREALAAERPKQIAPMQSHPVVETIIGDVARGDVERIPRNIHGVDLCLRERMRGEDREAPGPGAQLEHRADGNEREGIARPVAHFAVGGTCRGGQRR